MWSVPRLSILIPCLTRDERFENTLASVLQNRPDDCEVVVVFSGFYDDPYHLSDEVRFLEAPENVGLVELVNVGIDHASGDVIHLLQCGAEVTESWASKAIRHFDEKDLGSVAPICLRPNQQRPVAGLVYSPGGAPKTRVVDTSRRTIRPPRVLGPTLAAGFYRRSALCQAGGFDAAAGEGWADVDMALSLQTCGYRAICEPDSRVTTELVSGQSISAIRSGSSLEYVFWKHMSRRGWLPSLLAHLLLLGGEMLLALFQPSLFARLLGRIHGGLRRRSPPYIFTEKKARTRSRQRTHNSINSPEANDGGRYSDGYRRHVA